MGDGIWSAASGARVQLRQLDVTANNVANASTLGYRGDTLTFREVIGRAGRNERVRPCRVDSVAANPAPGVLKRTGRRLDVALVTPGYLTVRTTEGERYTRVGALRVSNTGRLETAEGSAVLGTDRKPILVGQGAPESDVTVDQHGDVMVRGAQVARLLVVEFPKDGALEKAGGGLLTMTREAGPPAAVEGRFESGALEGSNVSAVRGMVDIVNATRAFEACEKAMEAFHGAGKRGASTVISPR